MGEWETTPPSFHPTNKTETMSEATQNQELNDDLQISPEEELAALKSKADLLGVKYHPSISADKLRAKIKEHVEKPQEVTVEQTAEAPEAKATESVAEMRVRLRKEAMKLVRVNITCMNPFKREWESEIFTAGNTMVGTVRRCVPFNADWHIEQILLNMLKERKCQVFYTDKVDGRQVRRAKLINEFAIQELPALTPQELKELARRQAISKVED